MKPEFLTTNGTYIGVAPKSYICSNHSVDGDNFKKATKGVPPNANLTLADFGAVLMNDEQRKFEMNNLLQNKDREMTRIKFNKTGLTSVSLKMHILPDKISCVPFQYK